MSYQQGASSVGNSGPGVKETAWRKSGSTIERFNTSGPITVKYAATRAGQYTPSKVVEWKSFEYDNRVLTLAAPMAASTAGATTVITVDRGALAAIPGTVLLVPSTREYLFVVTAATSDTSIGVVRGHGRVNADPVGGVASGATITNTGTAFPEMAGAGTMLKRNGIPQKNYMQIHKQSFGMSRTRFQTVNDFETGKQMLTREESDALERIREDADRTCLMGQLSHTYGANGEDQRTSMGLFSFIQTNRRDFAGSLSLNTIQDELNRLFKFGMAKRSLYGGDSAITAISTFLSEDKQYQKLKPVEEYGYVIDRIIAPNGILELWRHPLLTQDPFFNTCAFIIPENGLQYHYVQDVKKEMNVEQKGVDGFQHQFMGEFCYSFGNEREYAFWEGIGT